jgi:hypothetical protein
MAYAKTIAVTKPLPDVWLLTINETDCANTSEAEVVFADHPLPKCGTVIAATCSRVSGTGTTVDPVLGVVTDPGAAPAHDVAIENGTAAAAVSLTGPATYGPTTKLFHRSRPDAGSDNVIVSTYKIRAGWLG